MKRFIENRTFIQNEFEEAHWDTSTGLAPDVIASGLKEIELAGAEQPWQTVYAEGYAYLLDHLQLEINEHTPFSVKLNLGIDFSYFAGRSIFSSF